LKILLLFLTVNLFAISGYIETAFYSPYQARIEYERVTEDFVFSTNIYLEEEISFLTIYSFTETMMLKSDSIFFKPFNVQYLLGIKGNFSNVTCSLEHSCKHPVTPSGFDNIYIEESYNKLSVRYNF